MFKKNSQLKNYTMEIERSNVLSNTFNFDLPDTEIDKYFVAMNKPEKK